MNFFEGNKRIVIVIMDLYKLQASTMLGQYLILQKNHHLFVDWLRCACGADKKQAAACYRCLNDWCEQFL